MWDKKEQFLLTKNRQLPVAQVNSYNVYILDWLFKNLPDYPRCLFIGLQRLPYLVVIPIPPTCIFLPDMNYLPALGRSLIAFGMGSTGSCIRPCLYCRVYPAQAGHISALPYMSELPLVSAAL